MDKRKIVILGCALMAGCVTSPPRLVNQNDSAVRFSKLGSGGRGIAQEFYDLGAGDTVRRLYWSQRAGQQLPSTAEASPTEKLTRRYVNLPSPPFQDADGVLREGSVHAVEIVQLWEKTKSHGRTLNIVK